jgi:hypothetical protein
VANWTADETAMLRLYWPKGMRLDVIAKAVRHSSRTVSIHARCLMLGPRKKPIRRRPPNLSKSDEPIGSDAAERDHHHNIREDAAFQAAVMRAIKAGRENPPIGIVKNSKVVIPVYFARSTPFSGCGSSSYACAELGELRYYGKRT